MPLYDLACGHEAFLPWKEDPHVDCPECGPTTRLPCAAKAVGILPTNPLVLDRREGKELRTNQELRDFERKHPNIQIVSANSDDWKRHHDRVKNLAEDRAVKRGFRDFRHQAESKRDARRKQAEGKKTGPG